MSGFAELPPLSMYIHLPWCVRKCPYCDFNSHALVDNLPEAEYIDAVLMDLEQELPMVWGRCVQSIFIGGGTPSLFSAEQIDRLLQGVRARVTVKPYAEITLEANPGTVEQERFIAYRESGVNRISIGVQSFNDRSLQFIGRIHGSKESHNAVTTALKASFESINIDLMFVLPRQGLSGVLDDVAIACSYGVSHISHYQLTIEPNTYFNAHPPVSLPDDEHSWEMLEQSQAIFEKNQYQRYEVSAYAKQDNVCRHNVNYWQFGDYLGIGAGAHGKITSAESQTIYRYMKAKQPKQYLGSVYRNEHKLHVNEVSAENVVFEYMLNNLRLVAGFSIGDFEKKTGLSFGVVESTVHDACARGLLEFDGNVYKPSRLGMRFLNDLQTLFLPD